MSTKKRNRRARYKVTDEWQTCPDCSERDAVSFTFGHLSRRAMEDPTSTETGEPVISFARTEKGLSRTRGCETCGVPGGVSGMIRERVRVIL